MKTVVSLIDLRLARAQLQEPVGFVPTMGYLHKGHFSLVRLAREACASVVASIFVNPTQFGPSEDLASYPRNLERDLALLGEAGVDLVWTPTSGEMYLPAFQTWVSVDDLTAPLEGALRPRHFRGVTTVVAKLFNAVQPQKAYFGQKDAQQAAVVGRMVQDLNFPIEIVVCPTVREPDGLAMSSRNVYLDPDERRAATVLHRALLAAQDAFRSGQTQAGNIRSAMQGIFDREPLAKVEYIAIVDPETFHERDQISGGELVLLAVKIGRTRLIDNTFL